MDILCQKRTRSLVLLMVVDLIVPEERLHSSVSHLMSNGRGTKTDLVTIAPPEVLGADILVRVLGLLFHGRLVGLVLPMGIPPQLRIDASDDQSGNGDAAVRLAGLLGCGIFRTRAWRAGGMACAESAAMLHCCMSWGGGGSQ